MARFDIIPFFSEAQIWASQPGFLANHKAGDATDYVTDDHDDYAADVMKDVVLDSSLCLGNTVDVVSLLSYHGNDIILVRNSINGDGDVVKAENLRGKSVIFCCFCIPLRSDPSIAQKRRAVIAAYSELLSSKQQIELVVVAKMRRQWANEEVVFNEFMSGFPPSCLTIPFSSSHWREYICKLLSSSYPSQGVVAALLLDCRHTILHRDLSVLVKFGAFFPFTNEQLGSLRQKVERMSTMFSCTDLLNLRINKENGDVRLALDELLKLNPSDFLWDVAKAKKIAVSDLKKKLVLLYLCYDGYHLVLLNSIYDQCVALGLELEIVLVFLPFSDDAMSIQKRICSELKTQNHSFWVLPFVDSVSRWLWVISGYEYVYDHFIILEPGANCADVDGYKLIYRFGIWAYPFTKEAFVDKETARLGLLKLESLLAGSEKQNFLVRANGNLVRVTELQGKNVLLILDKSSSHLLWGLGELYETMFQKYDKIKTMYPDLEVVFVPAVNGFVSRNSRLSAMPWLVLPYHPVDSARLIKQLTVESGSAVQEVSMSSFGHTPGDVVSLVAINGDGRICSVGMDYMWLEVTPCQDLFIDNLRQHVGNHLVSLLEEMKI